MGEFLAFYMLCGFAINIFAILRFRSNPPALEIMGAICMWPLVLLTIIMSFTTSKNDDN